MDFKYIIIKFIIEEGILNRFLINCLYLNIIQQ